MLKPFILALILVFSFSHAQAQDKAQKQTGDPVLLEKAERGILEAQLRLAEDYLRGRNGLEHDKASALLWLEKAIAQKDCETVLLCREGIGVAGNIYASGEGVPPDLPKAKKLLKRAAEAGSGEAAKRLGLLLSEEPASPANAAEAYYWLNMARGGKNAKSDALIAEISAQLSAKEIAKIDARVTAAKTAMEEQQRQRLLNLLDSKNLSEKDQLTQRLYKEIMGPQYDLRGIEEIIKAGADVNAGNGVADTPLMLAAEKGHADIIRLLLQHGADIDATNLESRTALNKAVSYKKEEAALALIEAGAKIEPVGYNDDGLLIAAARNGNTAIVDALIAKGADVNEVGKLLGLTPLISAAKAGHGDVIESLLKAGADLNLPRKNDYHSNVAAVDFAIEAKHYDIARRLVAAGATPKLPIPDEPTQPAHETTTEAVEAPKAPDPAYTSESIALSRSAIRSLQSPSESEVDAAIKMITEHAEDYNASALDALSSALFRKFKDEEGIFWFYAAGLRSDFDYLACKDPRGYRHFEEPGWYGRTGTEYIKKNPEKQEAILKKVAEWDAATANNYDPLWILPKNQTFVAPSPETMCLSKERREHLKPLSRAEFLQKSKSIMSSMNPDVNARAPLPGEILSLDDIKARAEEGDASSQYKLSMSYRNNRKLPKETREAEYIKWLQASADQDYGPALLELGKYYFIGPRYVFHSGDRTGADREKAMQILEKAIKVSENPAFVFERIADLLQQDRKNRESMIQAYAWSALAQKNGNSNFNHTRLATLLNDDELKEALTLSEEYAARYLPVEKKSE